MVSALTEKFIEILLSAVIAYLLPKLFERLEKKGKKVFEHWKRKREIERVFQKRLQTTFPWATWCVAHAIGGAFGALLGALMTTGPSWTWPLQHAAVFGACIGISQWVILRKYLDVTPIWAVVTVFGWSGFLLTSFLELPQYLSWPLTGCMLGTLQWLILRQHRAKSVWWIFTNVVAWLLGGFAGVAASAELLALNTGFAIAWILGWAVASSISSIVLGFALSKMPPKQPTDSFE